ncbi:SulP family inorganic anion transporter [Lentisphaera profundi]|uniref:SulP family inorganic anion transporter n=1 Tax=Lentisphaera profundi TaxID=1658616 RepID=A0ABY7VQ13_9BACT|nr:SulP family inorganic anion transporter [Lentisphaera profundi]WDE95303.1 SulP family inorganic anion transporter [Lentisphaera profundi]
MLKKLFPFLDWFPIKTIDLKDDLVAGITVALLLVPQSMAYAELAGLPVRYGLYAAIIPVALMALFGKMAQISGGPTAMTGIITASVLFPLVQDIPPELREARYIELAILLSLTVGVCRLLMGVFKLSSLVNLLSHPVIAGFTNAAAIVIALSQLPKLLGISGISIQQEFMGLIKSLASFANNLDQIHPLSAITGVISLLGLVYLKKIYRKVPWPLIIVAGSCFVFWKFGIQDEALIVGEIPNSFPSLSFPKNSQGEWLDTIILLIPASIMITLIGFVETVSISKAISFKTRQPMNLDQELIGQGIGSIAGAFAQAYPVGSSFTRSALNLVSGARTGMSNIFAVLSVIFVLLFLTPALYYLPKATLAALIISSTFGLIDFEPIRVSWRVMRREGLVAIFTFVATLCFAPSIMDGFLWGAGISIAAYLYRTMKPRIDIYDWSESCPSDLRTRSLHIAALRFRCAIFFASVEAFEEAIITCLAQSKNVKFMLIEAQSINRIDASGEWGLRNLVNQLKSHNVELVFAALPAEAKEMMNKTQLDQLIGEENFYPDTTSAIHALHERINGRNLEYMI